MLNKDNYSSYYTYHRGLPVIVSGPSGAGKSLICREYVKSHPDTVLSISDTTRTIRKGEVAGKDYNFITDKEFEKRRQQGYYLESAGKYGNFYGTPKKKIEENLSDGKNVILEIEMQGALQVKQLMPEVVMVFVLPNSFKELENQIRGRKTETEETIKLRLSQTKMEIEEIVNYDYVLINQFGHLDKAILKLGDIITAERLSVKRILEQYK